MQVIENIAGIAWRTEPEKALQEAQESLRWLEVDGSLCHGLQGGIEGIPGYGQGRLMLPLPFSISCQGLYSAGRLLLVRKYLLYPGARQSACHPIDSPYPAPGHWILAAIPGLTNVRKRFGSP